MKRKLPHFLIACLLAGLSAPAVADTTGPLPGFLGAPPWFEDVKSPPLTDSDTFGVEWAMHVTFAFTNYAGVLFDLQYDGSEMSSLVVSPLGPHFGNIYTLSGSQQSTQVAFPLSVWHPNAVNSGTTVQSSSLVPLFAIEGHAKNTTPANNSDIDISISVWQILHIVSSGTYVVNASDYVYVSPAGGYAPPLEGTWLHVSETFTTFIPQSAFVATNAFVNNVAGFGIEHVPEPVSALLLLGGSGALFVGRRRRRA
jgi:hypothetical protein